MIEFLSSFKLNEVHKVNSTFNDDSKNIICFRGGPNFGRETVGTISNFYPVFWLCNNCDVINARNSLFLETNKINQFMQFSIKINTAKLLFIHLVLTQYGCLNGHLPFHCNIRQLVCQFNFLIRKFLGSERL